MTSLLRQLTDVLVPMKIARALHQSKNLIYEKLKKGEIPSSLRSDYVHGNKHYHRLLGEPVSRRMQYLGYCR